MALTRDWILRQGRKHLVGTTQIKNDDPSIPEPSYNAKNFEIPVHVNLTQGEREPPVFCPKSDKGPVEPITLSKRLTTSSHITVSFRGWSDNESSVLASGIESYAISVFEVKDATPEMLLRDITAVAGPYNCSKDITEVDIQLPEKNPMLYAVLLEVKDKANNVGYARRFVLYDNSSYIVKNDNIPFRVVSASNKSHFTWQVQHGSICYSWKNRFLNNRYKKSNPLRPIKSENSIEGIYDQMSGILPVTGMNNVNGLIDFFFALIRNAGTDVGSGRVMNFTSQSICLNPSMNDGDTFLLRLQARDIMNHTLNDNIQVHIDRSVPEIADIWLIRNEKKQLYVHHSSDLSTIYFEFKAFDLHSGIREIKWAFGIYENNTVLIEKAIAVEETTNSSSCNSTTTCYCPMIGECTSTTYVAELKKLKTLKRHNGNHNRRYFFTVTATNNAFLVAYDHIDILVDESPPDVGVVLEGPIGSPDIDYTSINEVTVHWHGLIDHESGIKFYKVAISRDCIYNLKDTVIGNINGSIVLETNHESTKMVFPDGQGKYHVTVIAFNNAMSPSKIACSDGIIFDESVPEIVNITWDVREDHSQIAHAFVGFGRDKSSIDRPDLMDYTKTHHLESYIQHHPGFIGEKRMFVFIKVQNRAGLDQKIWFGPLLADETPPVCQAIPKPVIDNDYVIAKWDKGNFYDTEQTEEIGSVMFRVDSFQGCSDGFLVDDDILKGGKVSIVSRNGYVVEGSSINIQWSGFYGNSKGADIGYQNSIAFYQYAIGTSVGGHDVQPFTTTGLTDFVVVTNLHLQSGQVYYASVRVKTWTSKFVQGVKYYCIMKACNGARLCSHGSSNGVIIDNSAPIPGLVVVGEPGIHSRYQSDNSSLHATWIGFEDPQSGIDHFEVYIGTRPLLCDIMNRWNVSLSSAFVKSQLELRNDVPIFEDDRSPIVRTTITISSKLDSHIPMSDTVISNENVFTVKLVKDNQLRLGDIYVIKVTACNAALLCSTAHSEEVLLDYSPPQIGGFMPPLSWEVIHGASNFIRFDLSWYGFSDVESTIKTYYISIGYDYNGKDIVGAYKVKPAHQDEGRMQHTTIHIDTTNNLPEKIVFTIWAENYAGISSSQSKITTDVVSFNRNYTKGNLVIQKHSCVAEYCNKDCTCAVVGQKCKTASKPECNIKTDNNGKSSDRVRIIVPNTDIGIVGSSSCLRSEWTEILNETIWRFEYTFGIQDSEAGNGIFVVLNENPWQDVGKETKAIHSDDIVRMHDVGHKTREDWTGLSFEPGTRYYTTVRAINKIGLQTELSSDGFVIDDIAPIAGIVYNTGHHSDIIYQSINQTVQFSWHGFEDEHSFIDSYYVGFIVNGKGPMANDSVSFQKLDIHDHIVYDGKLNHGDKITATVKAIDKAGHESPIVTSLPLSIDNTPPQSFDCNRYEEIYEKQITGKNRWLDRIKCHKNSVYKIKVSVTDVTFGFKALLTVGDMSMVLPFARNSDGSLVTEYNFFSFETALKHFFLDIYGALKSTAMLISVSTCSAVDTEAQDNDIVIAQQISSDRISICVRTIDLDSGIKQVNIGIGSVNGGFELQTMKSAMSSSHRMHDIVEANLTHGERIYVKAVVINHAGLQTEFTSSPFIVDHSSPIIQSLESSLLYVVDVQNDTTTSVHSRWQVIDDESDVKFCEYCIGFSESSCDIIGWTATSSISLSQSKYFRVQHGSIIFLKLRCINGVQLSGYAYTGPLVISYIPPENIGSKIQFITDTGINNVTGDQET
ncbi:uncharacterized protein LOC127711868, partial [Mytilus californianus]|uniref:uncharacterized protein LOC127711868 n=1 Tax=Mytilus californianus TaxID=6549 RepID=UPI002248065A